MADIPSKDDLKRAALDACAPSMGHIIGDTAKGAGEGLAAGIVAGILAAPVAPPAVLILPVVGVLSGAAMGYEQGKKPDEVCVTKHIAAAEHVATHDAPLNTPLHNPPASPHLASPSKPHRASPSK